MLRKGTLKAAVDSMSWIKRFNADCNISRLLCVSSMRIFFTFSNT